jgi:hypothetical protein
VAKKFALAVAPAFANMLFEQAAWYIARAQQLERYPPESQRYYTTDETISEVPVDGPKTQQQSGELRLHSSPKNRPEAEPFPIAASQPYRRCPPIHRKDYDMTCNPIDITRRKSPAIGWLRAAAASPCATRLVLHPVGFAPDPLPDGTISACRAFDPLCEECPPPGCSRLPRSNQLSARTPNSWADAQF